MLSQPLCLPSQLGMAALSNLLGSVVGVQGQHTVVLQALGEVGGSLVGLPLWLLHNQQHLQGDGGGGKKRVGQRVSQRVGGVERWVLLTGVRNTIASSAAHSTHTAAAAASQIPPVSRAHLLALDEVGDDLLCQHQLLNARLLPLDSAPAVRVW